MLGKEVKASGREGEGEEKKKGRGGKEERREKRKDKKRKDKRKGRSGKRKKLEGYIGKDREGKVIGDRVVKVEQCSVGRVVRRSE